MAVVRDIPRILLIRSKQQKLLGQTQISDFYVLVVVTLRACADGCGWYIGGIVRVSQSALATS